MSLWSRFANVFRGDRLSREIDEELESHLQEAIEQDRDPAEVRKAFGSALRQRDESRDLGDVERQKPRSEIGDKRTVALDEVACRGEVPSHRLEAGLRAHRSRRGDRSVAGVRENRPASFDPLGYGRRPEQDRPEKCARASSSGPPVTGGPLFLPLTALTSSSVSESFCPAAPQLESWLTALLYP